MIINYKHLVSQEFVETCRTHKEIDDLELKRAKEQGQKTIAILESQGISTEEIPIVQLELMDYLAKDFVVYPYSLFEELQRVVLTENPRMGLDRELYQHYRDQVGRAVAETMRMRIERKCEDPRRKKLLENLGQN